MPGRDGAAGAGALGSAKLNGRGQTDSASVGAGRVEARDGNDDVLADKQNELEGIVDRHDDLVRGTISHSISTIYASIYQVREMFQMEKFLNMLLYDPKVRWYDLDVGVHLIRKFSRLLKKIRPLYFKRYARHCLGSLCAECIIV
jgi:hypothetical protein